ncbi:O-antigen ligase family protein [Pseudomonas monteilii]|uniref:O-antigen ligase family protein n=1 Tax=Pseudomonas monteilii TaxID=76759 RepID=UPI0018AB4570|nr:O-antigen ligase family protein [Pseudomonas monteilii]MBF8748657.1 O-antigen ligase family protein [Pseudomonas monteilii]
MIGSSKLVVRPAVGFLYHLCLLSIFVFYAVLNEHRIVLVLLVFLLLLFYLFALRVSTDFILSVDKVLLLAVVLGLLLLQAVGQLFWESNEHSLLLVAPFFIVILFFSCNMRELKGLLFYLLLFMVLLAVYEKLVGSYIFVGSLDVNGAQVVLDESLYGGAAGDLRAKALFYGPLTFSAFLIGTSFVLRANRVALLFCFLGAAVAISRTSMILVPAIALVGLLFGANKKVSLLIPFGFVLLLGLIVGIIFSPSLLIRVSESLDFSGGSATNSARVYYWVSGVDEFLKYDVAHKLVGNNGYFRSVYNNNAESGWITLLLDFGIVGFMLYLAPLIYVVNRNPSVENFCLFAILFVANMVFTLCYGVTGCFMYWLMVVAFIWGRE